VVDHKLISSSLDDPEDHEDCEIRLPQQLPIPQIPYQPVNIHTKRVCVSQISHTCYNKGVLVLEVKWRWCLDESPNDQIKKTTTIYCRNAGFTKLLYSKFKPKLQRVNYFLGQHESSSTFKKNNFKTQQNPQGLTLATLWSIDFITFQIAINTKIGWILDMARKFVPVGTRLNPS